MTSIEKYTWLLDTIRKNAPLSLKEINAMWLSEQKLGELDRSTFNRWKARIGDIFHVEIKCRRKGGYRYYIDNPEEIEDDRLSKWMLDSFAVNRQVGSSLKLKDRIIVERIPSGRVHLAAILEAMTENRVVEIEYHKFGCDSYRFPVEPYCVRLFNRRWYMVARNNRGRICVYGLDRIDHVERLDECFQIPEDFNGHDYFEAYYGITTRNEIPRYDITVRAYYPHNHYMMTLPMHHTQEIIADEGDYTDFGFYLRPTEDFFFAMLQAGSLVEIISPPEVRDEMKSWVAELYELYKYD